MLLALAAGWVQQWNTTTVTDWTYNLPADECLNIAYQFYGDYLFTWGHTDCATVERQTRQAFDSWQVNSNLRFVPVSSRADINIRLSAADEKQPGVLAWTTHDEIVLSRSCWYADRTFCKAISNIPQPVALATIIAVLQVITVMPLIFIKRTQLRKVLSTALISQYIILYVIVWPCLTCFDLETSMMHEIGHFMGIGHSDDKKAGHLCGCQQYVKNGTCSSKDSIMHSKFSHKYTACLSRDDVDAARTLHGGVCDAPVYCFYTDHTIGYNRIPIAIAYASIIVLTASLTCRLCRYTMANIQHDSWPHVNRAAGDRATQKHGRVLQFFF